MSTSKLKTSVDELIRPLLKRLELANDSIGKDLASLSRMTGVQTIFEEIHKVVKEIKEYFDAIEKFERNLIDKLGKLERELDYYSENNKGTLSIDDLVENLCDKYFQLNEDRAFLGKMFGDKSNKEASNVPSRNTQLDLGESSNGNNQEKDGFIELKQCMEELQEPHLKNCLHSLAIFPENKELKKRLLVYWWTGIGIASRENENKTDENLGEEYFSKLVEKGVLNPIHREHNQEIDRFIINPKIHRQLIASCRSEGSFSKEKAKDDDTWHSYDYENGVGGSKVKALLNLDIKYVNSRDIISKMKGAQVLQLGRWRWHTELGSSKDHTEVDETDFLREMDQFLRYLSLRGISGITKLSESIGKLGDLRILDLRSCHNLECLPQKPISKLQKIFARVLPQCHQNKKWFDNLTHLDISECLLLDSIPKWICELSNLQVLKGFVVGLEETNKFCRLRDLSKLKKLRKLSIKIVNKHFNVMDISCLEPLENLFVLTVTWTIYDQRDSSGSPSNKNPTVDEEKKLKVEGDNIVKAEHQSGENTHKGLNTTNVEGEKIRGVNGSKTLRGKKHDIARSKKNGVNEGKIPVEKKLSKNNISRSEEKPKTNKENTISFPKKLDKLDLRCYPNDEAGDFLKSASLKNLKRLYIRGGKLIVIRDDTPWEVDILRLRFLKNFDFDWYKLNFAFPKLKYLEYEACPRLINFPRNRSHWKPEHDGHFPSGSFDDDDQEVVLSTNSENRSRRVWLDAPVGKALLVENKHTLWFHVKDYESLFMSNRDGLDLVVVLDISKSTEEGYRLAAMKRSILHFMDRFTTMDRLSIVTFHTIAKRLCRLSRVTDSVKAELTNLINSLETGGDPNIFDGLRMGLKVLKDRRLSSKRAVGILLMSSGAETIRFGDPTKIELGNVPVHTLKFYKDTEDQEVSRVLEAIANKSDGGKHKGIGAHFNLPQIGPGKHPFISSVFERLNAEQIVPLKIPYGLSELVGLAVGVVTLTITPIKEEATIVDVWGDVTLRSTPIKEQAIIVNDGDSDEISRIFEKNEISISKHTDGVVTVIVQTGSVYEFELAVRLDLSLPSTDKEHRAAVAQISYSYESGGEKFEGGPLVTLYVDRTAEVDPLEILPNGLNKQITANRFFKTFKCCTKLE